PHGRPRLHLPRHRPRGGGEGSGRGRRLNSVLRVKRVARPPVLPDVGAPGPAVVSRSGAIHHPGRNEPDHPLRRVARVACPPRPRSLTALVAEPPAPTAAAF